MIHAQDRSFIGVGMLSARTYQAPSGLLEIGNSTSLAIQHATEERNLPNYRTGVGNNNAQTRITGVTGSFTLHDVTPANLALLLNATINSVAAGEVTGEQHPISGQPRELIVFKHLVDASAPVTLTMVTRSATAQADPGNAGNGTVSSLSALSAPAGEYLLAFTSATEFEVTDNLSQLIGAGAVGVLFNLGGLRFTVDAGSSAFEEDDAFTITVTEAPGSAGTVGEDYIVTPYGIQLTENTGMTAGTLTVGYTRLAADVTEVLTQAAPGEKTLHFAGMNDAQNGEPFDISLHRVKFRLIEELPITGDEYAALSVTFEILQDTTRIGQGLSQFYTIRQLRHAA